MSLGNSTNAMPGPAEHTPGPWKFGIRRDGSMWLSLGDPIKGPHYQGDLVASPADARLIAESPAMYGAIKDFMRTCELLKLTEGLTYVQMKTIINRIEGRA
jgi:hypothetical protein